MFHACRLQGKFLPQLHRILGHGHAPNLYGDVYIAMYIDLSGPSFSWKNVVCSLNVHSKWHEVIEMPSGIVLRKICGSLSCSYFACLSYQRNYESCDRQNSHVCFRTFPRFPLNWHQVHPSFAYHFLSKRVQLYSGIYSSHKRSHQPRKLQYIIFLKHTV